MLIRSLEVLADDEVRESSMERDSFANDILVAIQNRLNEAMSPAESSALARALRTKNPLSERYRRQELEWLPESIISDLNLELGRLAKLSALAHQARTQAAYVAGVTRPFNPKYIFRWLNELSQAEAAIIKARIEDLERMEVNDYAELEAWSEGLVELFKDLVVARETDDEGQAQKIAGGISFKSSRTYIQSWLAFIRRNASALLGFDDVDLNQHVDTVLNRHDDLDQGMPWITESARAKSTSAQAASEQSGEFLRTLTPLTKNYDNKKIPDLEKSSSDDPKITTLQANRVKKTTPDLTRNSPSSRGDLWNLTIDGQLRPGLTISATSAFGEKSFCNFENLNGVDKSISQWIGALKVIWTGQPGAVKFDADLKSKGSHFQFSLQEFELEEATEKLTPLIQRMSDLF